MKTALRAATATLIMLALAGCGEAEQAADDGRFKVGPKSTDIRQRRAT